MNQINALAQSVYPKMVEVRRALHQNPEPSMQEFETTRRLAAEMDRLGIPYRLTQPTGLIAQIEGAAPGPRVALRADIDALSIGERTGLPFASQVPGMMHACGHDAHAAMLVGAAEILMACREAFAGSVRLIFQPAEETGQGARLMIEQGALEGVSMTFGLHLLACFKPGWLSAATGASAPAASRFSINIKGKTTHGARPEAGVDATVAASALVMNLQTIVSREMSPKQQVVVTVGQLHSGTRFNIVSGEAFLDGTVRCYDRDIHHAMPGIFERIVQGTAAAYRCEAELSYDKMVEVLINDEWGSQFVYEAAKKVVEEPSLATMGDTHMSGSDDFSEYTMAGRGAFAALGAGGSHPHHSEFFDIDESVMTVGAAYFAQVAMDYLNAVKQEG